MVLAFFHVSEYVTTALTNPMNLSTDSFLLNHSPAYHAAALASWAEYAIEAYFFPEMKTSLEVVSLIGNRNGHRKTESKCLQMATIF